MFEEEFVLVIYIIIYSNIFWSSISNILSVMMMMREARADIQRNISW